MRNLREEINNSVYSTNLNRIDIMSTVVSEKTREQIVFLTLDVHTMSFNMKVEL